MKTAVTITQEPDGACRITVGECFTIITREDAVKMGSALHQVFTLPWNPSTGEKDGKDAASVQR